jgi:cell division septation protein DedD
MRYQVRFVLLSFVFCILCTNISTAQGISINEDASVAKLLEQYVKTNQATENVTGWVVQIVSTTDRRQMESMVKNFQLKNPDIYVDWTQEKPYYKIYIGGFRTKLEAARLLNQFRSEFTGAFITKSQQLRPIAFIQS